MRPPWSSLGEDPDESYAILSIEFIGREQPLPILIYREYLVGFIWDHIEISGFQSIGT